MLTDRAAIEFLSYRTIGCALKVHRTLGPGVLELPNTLALAEELSAAGIHFRRDVPVAIVYKGTPLGCGYRLDLLIEDTLIVEVKSVREVTDVHKKQLLSYLKLTRRPVGRLINFNVALLQQGITRLINDAGSAGPAVAEIRGRSGGTAASLSSLERGVTTIPESPGDPL
jgi:GxxExxY protein